MWENKCVCCGKVIPEGQMVCRDCIRTVHKSKDLEARVQGAVDRLQELTDLAEQRKYDTPINSPRYERYRVQYECRIEFLNILKKGLGEE